MSAFQFSHALNFFVEECCNCHTPFAMTLEMQRLRKVDGKYFYCPNGHSQHYAETEIQRLKKQIELEQKKTQWANESREHAHRRAEKANRKARAFKGIATKIKKRVGNGVCPCCNRSFQNLHNHMKTMHPDFKGKDDRM